MAASRVILRIGKEGAFRYVDESGAPVKASHIMAYIKSLVIPPKYVNVRIFYRVAAGRACEPVKLTYTGVDPAGRTQYGYSAAWKVRASRNKFASLIEFGGVLPKIRATVAKLLQDPRATIVPDMATCIALVVRIVNMCHFRLGQAKYKALYKSYGVSTIEVRHLKFITLRGRDVARITFVGKKGVKNDCVIDTPDIVAHLANMARNKQPRDPVFTYAETTPAPLTAANPTATTPAIPIRAADVNVWMRQFGVDITSKMFRTYATNVMLIEQLNQIATKRKTAPDAETPTDRKKNINTALDEISGAIHNTRAVCKKEYTHPDLVELYMNHPRAFAARFMTRAGVDAEPAFLAFLGRD